MDLSRLRVDQNGSLAAPRALQDAFARFDRGELPEAEFHAAQNDAIRDALTKQEAVGLAVEQVNASQMLGCWGLTARSS